ncbi:ribonucleotide reductase, partial [Earliella scabrosa]
LRTFAARYLLRVGGVVVERPQFMFLRVALAIHGNDLAAVEATYNLLSKQILICPPELCARAGTTNTIVPLTATVSIEVDSEGSIRDGLDGVREHWRRGTHVAAVLTPLTHTGCVSGSVLLDCLQQIDEQTLHAGHGSEDSQPDTVAYVPLWHSAVAHLLGGVSPPSSGGIRLSRVVAGILVPDIFMERMHVNGQWTLFNPADAADLGQLWGGRFTARYTQYESAHATAIRIPARELWETIAAAQRDHPERFRTVFWCTLNRKNSLRHLGVLAAPDSSATCCPITTQDASLGVMALSVALPYFVTDEAVFDFDQFRRFVQHALVVADRLNDLIQQLDAKATMQARHARPVSLGIHGLADVFIALSMPHTSSEARATSLEIFQTFYIAVLSASCVLAQVHGACSTWTQSPAQRGEHFVDMWPVDVDPEQGLDTLRRLIARNGLHNCVVTSLPPMRWFPALHADGEAADPHFSNVISATSSGFTYQEIHPRLVAALEQEGMWNEDLAREIQAEQGMSTIALVKPCSIKHIAGIPMWIKRVFRTIWEWNPATLVDMAAERAPFIEQSYLTRVGVPRHQRTTRVSISNDALRLQYRLLRRQHR